jgi:hypothetical protein
VTRWIVAALLAVFVTATLLWMPPPEETAEAGVQTPGPAALRAPHAVDLRAERADPAPSFVETWLLSFPEQPPAALRLTLSIGKAEAGAPIPARLTAVDGDAAGFVTRVREVMAAGDEPAAPPTPFLDLQLVELGTQLSIDQGEIGTTVLAGAFVAAPAGDWRAYRAAFGENGPQCFLGISPSAGHAMLLMRESADGPAILARLRGLLRSRPSGT